MPEANKKLDFVDRKFIECSLDAGLTYAYSSRKLGVHESTVGREVARNKSVLPFTGGRMACEWEGGCEISGMCTLACGAPCKLCDSCDCTLICERFEPATCPRLVRTPHVCNGCPALLDPSGCRYQRWVYDAGAAQDKADKRASASRSGIDLTHKELESMVSTVKPLMKKGQSLEHIWNTHPGEFPVTARTFRNYVSEGVLNVANIDLPKVVRYKKRKAKKAAEPSLNPVYDGRTYDDFMELDAAVRDRAVEMDCVEGSRGSTQVILTLLFRSSNYQVMLLLKEHTRKEVQAALDTIEELIGLGEFRRCMGTLVTDHGHEFNNFKELEASCTVEGETRCKVFFCDPSRPDQKGACEKNHVELRKLLPKGTSFKSLDAETVAMVASHVNSYTRAVLDGAAPIDIAEKELPEGLTKGLGIVRIDPEEVVLKPVQLPKDKS